MRPILVFSLLVVAAGGCGSEAWTPETSALLDAPAPADAYAYTEFDSTPARGRSDGSDGQRWLLNPDSDGDYFAKAAAPAGGDSLREAVNEQPQGGGAGGQGDAAGDDAAGDQDAAAVPRKIIYQAVIDLVVEDFAEIESAAPKLVEEHGGYLADMQQARNSGDNRSGRWVARVPVARYEEFIEAVSGLGVPERVHQSGQDVTAEFYDLQARLAAKRKFETRLLKLVEDRTDGVKDLIEVERELSRVRTEIEQMEGRRRFLVNQTSMTTVTLSAREEREYQPPQAPTFAGRIASAWTGSFDSIGGTMQRAVVGVATAAPWALVGAAVLAPAWWWRRGNTRPPAQRREE